MLLNTVILSKKALEILVKGVNLDVETIADFINQNPQVIENQIFVSADELETVIREAKIKTRNIKRKEKTINFVVSEEELESSSMLPDLVVRIINHNDSTQILDEQEIVDLIIENNDESEENVEEDNNNLSSNF